MSDHVYTNDIIIIEEDLIKFTVEEFENEKIISHLSVLFNAVTKMVTGCLKAIKFAIFFSIKLYGKIWYSLDLHTLRN